MHAGDAPRKQVDLTRATAAAGSGITVADATVRGFPLVYVNRAFEELTGFAAADCLGRGCGFLQTDASAPEAVERLRAALAEGREEHVVVLNARRDGSTFHNAVRLAPIRDDAGRVVQVIGVQHDVSPVVERELHLAAERDRALRDLEGLLAGVLGAEERERRLLSETIHDDSLQYLLAAAQDLQELSAPSAEQAETLARARGNLEHAVRHLRGLVSSMHPVAVSAGEGLADTLRAVARSPSLRGRFQALVQVDPEAEGPCDEVVVAVVRELLANAARHAHAEHVSVRVSRHRRRINVYVRDDGVGLKPGQVRDARAAGHVGLTLARQRVEAAGGLFALKSSPGEGVAVSITLPVAPT